MITSTTKRVSATYNPQGHSTKFHIGGDAPHGDSTYCLLRGGGGGGGELNLNFNGI